MAFHPIKPETRERFIAAQQSARAERRADLIARLRAKVAEHGESSIWAEMLAETEAHA